MKLEILLDFQNLQEVEIFKMATSFGLLEVGILILGLLFITFLFYIRF